MPQELKEKMIKFFLELNGIPESTKNNIVKKLESSAILNSDKDRACFAIASVLDALNRKNFKLYSTHNTKLARDFETSLELSPPKPEPGIAPDKPNSGFNPPSK